MRHKFPYTWHTNAPISKPRCMGNILGKLPILGVVGVFQEVMEALKSDNRHVSK